MKKFNYDYERDIKFIQNTAKQRKAGMQFPISQHIKWMVFAQLSNNRPWQRIEKNKENIEKIFNNFDPEFIKQSSPDDLCNALLDIKCGNRQIKQQMRFLSQNVNTLERIEKEEGSVDSYFNRLKPTELAESLSSYKSKYKLKYMGLPLVCEYIKAAGIDIIKPDVHVCRLLKRLGYIEDTSAVSNEKEAISVCEKIANEYSVSLVYVDTVLWQYCANDKFEFCTEANPKCTKCNVKKCLKR